jgi:hypothetical protein
LSSRISPAFAAALALVATTLAASPALAHAICGPRVFPATLGIDDPGVSDELALPTVTYLPTNGSGVNEADISFGYTKTIFPDVGLNVSDGATFLNHQGWGRDDLNLGLSYQFFCLPDTEIMGTITGNVDIGKTYTNGMGNDFNTYSPQLDVGVGFGALPKSLNLLRPFAVTGEVSYDIPDQNWTNGAQNPQNFNWGFTIQYSLPYFSANISEIDNPFIKRLIPLTEFTFSKPVANFAPGSNVTTGTIQPGVMYLADTYQVSLEAILPMNSASGHGVGVVGELHFFLDDMFPNSVIGKPLFGVSK